jgi:hypothetical protein
MTRHLIDTPRKSEGTRLGQFVKIAREANPHHATRQLVARLRPQSPQRLAAYLRIARGQQS